MKRENEFLPILVVPAVPFENGIRFLSSQEQTDLDGEFSEVVWQILSHCNGHNSPDEIVQKSGLDKDLIGSILNDLKSAKIIIDSREQYAHFHKLSNNPGIYFRNLSHEEVRKHSASNRLTTKDGEIYKFHKDTVTPLFHLQTFRKSIRSFTNERLTRDQIGNICNIGYNLSRHAVPSGGGLYPLKLYVIVARDQKELKVGYYEYDAEKDWLVKYDDRIDIEQLKYCFGSEILPFNSGVQIIIAADLTRQPYKYSNRGYRLTLIEAGHVAQNISLYCAEQNLGSCELGGVLDEPLKAELQMPEQVYPLLGIAIGKESREPIFDEAKFLEDLESEFVGDDKPVKSPEIFSFKNGSFYGGSSAFTKYDGSLGDCFGTSSSPYMAKAKAIIESYERDRIFRYNETNNFIIKNTSGTAAFTSFENAEKRAILELIERDAIMKSYFERKSPNKISLDKCSIHIQKRAEFWKLQNRELYILDMSSNGVVTAHSLIISNEYPCVVVGSATSDISFETAATKAVQETEYELLASLDRIRPEAIEPDEVQEPSDHGLLYQYPKYLENISWLWQGKTVDKIPQVTKSISELKTELEIKTTDLSDPNAMIKVVRVESDKLIPISFGFNNIDFSHPAFNSIKIDPRSKKLPHYFA